MPFGKFKGVLLEDLPDPYLAWLAGLDDLREPLSTAVADEYRDRFGEDTAVPAGVRDAGDAIVSAGYRVLAARHHPDHGGQTAAMQDVNAAAAWLRRQLRSLSA
jgi:hypothetical protein